MMAHERNRLPVIRSIFLDGGLSEEENLLFLQFILMLILLFKAVVFNFKNCILKSLE